MATSHTGMISRLRASRRAAALLLLPLALLLSACHVDSAITVSAAGGVDVDVSVTGNKNLLDLSDISCEYYSIYTYNLPIKFAVEDKIADDSEVLCHFSGSVNNGIDGIFLIDNDSTYILRIPVKDFTAGYSKNDLQDTYRLVVHMPGDIVSASGDATINGSNVVYEGKLSDLDKDIEIEASKGGSTPLLVWVLVLLAVLLAVALLFSRYLRQKRAAQAKASSKLSAQGAKGDADSKSSSGRSDSISASTTDSTVALAPLPEKYMPTSSEGTSESYSEQIDMVNPVAQGSGADVVKREFVVPVLPSETDKVLPLPGMPPRIPMPEEAAEKAVADESLNEEDEDSLAGNEAAAFFSQFLDVTDDEDVDEETDL